MVALTWITEFDVLQRDKPIMVAVVAAGTVYEPICVSAVPIFLDFLFLNVLVANCLS